MLIEGDKGGQISGLLLTLVTSLKAEKYFQKAENISYITMRYYVPQTPLKLEVKQDYNRWQVLDDHLTVTWNVNFNGGNKNINLG